MHKPILKSAIFNSVTTTTYIAIIASSAYYTGKHNVGQTDTVFIPIFMLMRLPMELLEFSRGILRKKHESQESATNARCLVQQSEKCLVVY
jgi:hypothetical protein